MSRFNARFENAMRRMLAVLTCGLVFGACDVQALIQQSGSDASGEESISQLIVRYKSATATEAERVQRLSAHAGVGLAFKRPLLERTSVYALPRAVARSDAQRVADAVAADPAVEWAVVDRRMYATQATTTPNDTYFAANPSAMISPASPNSQGTGVPNGQWYLRGTEQASSINATGAWALTTGSSSIVTAVLDTGVLFNHPDLGCVNAAVNCSQTGGRLLPGYDFVSNATIANDGQAVSTTDDRDPDPSDPGDWVTPTDVTNNPGLFNSSCLKSDGSQTNSSWHGSFVTSIVGARTNNAAGIAAIDQQGLVLPVRVLGKCGGLTSDIIDAMRWAVGISIAGIPDNPKPARVLNLSLGGKGVCSAAEQAAVDDVRARGAIVVAAAGNESGTVTSPANCNGVIAVAGLRNEGDKVGYSSLGPEVKISAPAGNCGTVQGSVCQFGIIGASNTGTTVPATNTYSNEVGTSFSAPLVSGVATLMLSVHPGLLPDAVLARLQQSARKFPTVTETVVDPATGALVTSALPQCNSTNPPSGRPDNRCNCTTSTCGAGMLDALGAVNAALRPQALITGSATVAPGSPELLSGASSTASAGRTIAAYAWKVLSAPAGATASGASTAQFSVTSAVAGGVTVQLTVTDTQAQVDTATATFTVGNPAPASAPPPASGGGGAIGVLGLLLLASAHLFARRNRLLRG